MRLILRRRPAAALRDDRSGVAFVEFAFALPILLALALTGVEVANLAVTILRLNQLAMLAADNTARYRKSIDEADIEEVAVGLGFAGGAIKFGERGRAIISAFESNSQTDPAKKGYQITWQRCFGARNATSSWGVQGAGKNDASMKMGMGPVLDTATGRKLQPVENSALIFAELQYNYVPVVAPFFLPSFTLSSIQSFPVRERAGQDLTNTTSISQEKKRLCDANHLASS